tara:strand:- start:42 stop:233 length:192 start_codon:yes stop_codon:yes gene_type:complete
MAIKTKTMFVSVYMQYNVENKEQSKEKERVIEAIMSEAGEFICNLANDEGIETNHYKWGTQAK